MGIERAYSAFVSAAVCSCMYLLHTLWFGYTVQTSRRADCQGQTGNAVGSLPPALPLVSALPSRLAHSPYQVERTRFVLYR